MAESQTCKINRNDLQILQQQTTPISGQAENIM